jgi:riboflavin synthase
MFTGLVQSLGTVSSVIPDGAGGLALSVSDPMAPSLALGESVAVNGCCLTVVTGGDNRFAFQLGPETLAKTAFGTVAAGDRVNLERALAVGERLGGHFVTGHIDAVGTIESVEESGEWTTIRFAVPAAFDELLVTKGSIAVDGVSLTLVDVEPGRVSVMLIPHTKAHTTLGVKRVGDPVHLEFDLIAKHVKKLFATLSVEI